MPFSYVQDVPDGTMDDYRRIMAAVGDERPTGLIAHTVGPTEAGIRFIDVWESEEAWQRFATDRLRPAREQALGSDVDTSAVRIDVLDVQHSW